MPRGAELASGLSDPGLHCPQALDTPQLGLQTVPGPSRLAQLQAWGPLCLWHHTSLPWASSPPTPILSPPRAPVTRFGAHVWDPG